MTFELPLAVMLPFRMAEVAATDEASAVCTVGAMPPPPPPPPPAATGGGAHRRRRGLPLEFTVRGRVMLAVCAVGVVLSVTVAVTLPLKVAVGVPVISLLLKLRPAGRPVTL